MQRQIAERRQHQSNTALITPGGEHVGQTSEAWTVEPSCGISSAWLNDQPDFGGNRLCLNGLTGTDVLADVGWSERLRSFWGGDYLSVFSAVHNGQGCNCYFDIQEYAGSISSPTPPSAQWLDFVVSNDFGVPHCN